MPEAREDGRRLHSGDVHTHTNYSDGSGTPAGLLYEAALSGMDFLVITDHGTTNGAERLVAAQAKTNNRFPIIVGEEIILTPYPMDAAAIAMFWTARPQSKSAFGELLWSFR